MMIKVKLMGRWYQAMLADVSKNGIIACIETNQGGLAKLYFDNEHWGFPW